VLCKRLTGLIAIIFVVRLADDTAKAIFRVYVIADIISQMRRIEILHFLIEFVRS